MGGGGWGGGVRGCGEGHIFSLFVQQSVRSSHLWRHNVYKRAFLFLFIYLFIYFRLKVCFRILKYALANM